MKKNRAWLILFIAIISAAAVFALWQYKFSKTASSLTQAASETAKENPSIEYWTCSMHPQVRKDGPGKCPICGMDLVPIYKQDKDKIVIDTAKAQALGMKSRPVARRSLVKLLRLPARISHDMELYVLQQEYLSALSSFNKLKELSSPEVAQRSKALLEASQLRLKLLGFDDAYTQDLEGAGAADESLIYPSQGRVWIHADIYEQDIGLVKPGQEVRARIKGFAGEEFKGKVKAIETVLSTMTRSAKARIEISDPQNRLKQELFADLTVEIDLGNRLSILRNSLIDTGTRKLVYVDLGEGRYQLREVETGLEAQGYVEVLSGLQENETVVDEGNFLLDSQTSLTGGQSLLYGAGEEVKQGPAQGEPHRH